MYNDNSTCKKFREIINSKYKHNARIMRMSNVPLKIGTNTKLSGTLL